MDKLDIKVGDIIIKRSRQTHAITKPGDLFLIIDVGQNYVRMEPVKSDLKVKDFFLLVYELNKYWEIYEFNVGDKYRLIKRPVNSKSSPHFKEYPIGTVFTLHKGALSHYGKDRYYIFTTKSSSIRASVLAADIIKYCEKIDNKGDNKGDNMYYKSCNLKSPDEAKYCMNYGTSLTINKFNELKNKIKKERKENLNMLIRSISKILEVLPHEETKIGTVTLVIEKYKNMMWAKVEILDKIISFKKKISHFTSSFPSKLYFEPLTAQFFHIRKNRKKYINLDPHDVKMLMHVFSYIKYQLTALFSEYGMFF